MGSAPVDVRLDDQALKRRNGTERDTKPWPATVPAGHKPGKRTSTGSAGQTGMEAEHHDQTGRFTFHFSLFTAGSWVGAFCACEECTPTQRHFSARLLRGVKTDTVVRVACVWSPHEPRHRGPLCES